MIKSRTLAQDLRKAILYSYSNQNFSIRGVFYVTHFILTRDLIPKLLGLDLSYRGAIQLRFIPSNKKGL